MPWHSWCLYNDVMPKLFSICNIVNQIGRWTKASTPTCRPISLKMEWCRFVGWTSDHKYAPILEGNGQQWTISPNPGPCMFPTLRSCIIPPRINIYSYFPLSPRNQWAHRIGSRQASIFADKLAYTSGISMALISTTSSMIGNSFQGWDLRMKISIYREF